LKLEPHEPEVEENREWFLLSFDLILLNLISNIFLNSLVKKFALLGVVCKLSHTFLGEEGLT
jgi:hypothetical protein